MTTPRRPTKQPSGWGGFLQQAVASVESRLDTILADEEDQTVNRARSASAAREDAPSKRVSADLSRSDSGAKVNDRLQERLARAMAKKKSEGRTGSPMSISESISRAATPVVDHEEDLSVSTQDTLRPISPASDDPRIGLNGPLPIVRVTDKDEKDDHLSSEVQILEIPAVPPSSPAVSLATSAAVTPARTSIDRSSLRTASSEAKDSRPSEEEERISSSISQPQAEHDASEKRWQEELHSYVERIDALQSKVQYLTKDAAESAQKAAAAAQTGSVEQKMFEKDKKIALLMEEGQNLSKTEMKHLTTIKKLRAQAAADMKDQSSMKIRAERAERNFADMEQRANRAEAAERRARERIESSSHTDRDFEAVTKERNALAATVADIKSQLSRATNRAEAAEKKAQADELQREKKASDELRDALASAKIECDINEEKLMREIRELNSSVEGEKERFKALEIELRGEQAVLESKLESLRSRAEEASSNTHGDAQAKLLRQIETLQNQYAVASENWQGIEGSLLARVRTLEKERDDVTKREGDLRKKLRDATLKAKKAESELETNRDKIHDLERTVAELKDECQRMARKAHQSEEQLSKTKRDFDEHQECMNREVARRLEEEKTRLSTQASATSSHRNGSPVASIRKPSGLDLSHLIASSYSDVRSPSRRASVMPVTDVPPRQSSSAPSRGYANGTMPETPSIHSIDHDEYFSSMPPTPASPAHAHRGVNDLISTSTVGAGPSVQLVERMSATVRRLGSEKAASKDELIRLTAQRDESRQEVVSLMREVGVKRASDDRIRVLEEEQRGINDRYQTTLELLGEKSELVEELKADVADLKQMYRDLVDSTMK